MNSFRSRILLVSCLSVRTSDVPLFLMKAFKEVGCEVSLFPIDEELPFVERLFFQNQMHFNRRLFNKRLLKKAFRWKPDILFIYGSNWGIFPETIRKIKKWARIVLWEGNLQLVKSYQIESLPLYDYVLLHDSYLIPLLERIIPVNRIFLVAQGCDPQEHRKIELDSRDKEKFGSDISFIGSGYSERVKFFENLSAYNLKLWGGGWQNSSLLMKCAQEEPVYGLKKTKIYNATKISLNMLPVQINGVQCRIFEVTACGGFIISEAKKDIELYYDIGKEIITYENIDDLKEKVDYYLCHPNEREVIAELGRKRAITQHTYKHRVKQILEIIDR